MDHWQAVTPRGPMTQYGARRLMDDFAKQISAVGSEGLDMFAFQVYGPTEMLIEHFADCLRDDTRRWPAANTPLTCWKSSRPYKRRTGRPVDLATTF